MKRYEYMHVNKPDIHDEVRDRWSKESGQPSRYINPQDERRLTVELLNVYGEKGWELVATLEYYWIFKREKDGQQ